MQPGAASGWSLKALSSKQKSCLWMCSHLHALETVMSGTWWPLLKTSDAYSVTGSVRLMEGSSECWMYTSGPCLEIPRNSCKL